MKIYHYEITGWKNPVGLLSFLMKDACMSFKEAKQFRDNTKLQFRYPQDTPTANSIRDGRSSDKGFVHGVDWKREFEMRRLGIEFVRIDGSYETESEKEQRIASEEAKAAHAWYDTLPSDQRKMIDALLREQIVWA